MRLILADGIDHQSWQDSLIDGSIADCDRKGCLSDYISSKLPILKSPTPPPNLNPQLKSGAAYPFRYAIDYDF